MQGSVMAFADPWHGRALAGTYRRTGEGRQFPIQDGDPPSKLFLKKIKSMGVEMYIHHPVPDENEQQKFIDAMKDENMSFLLGNECGTINKTWKPGKNRFDFSPEIIASAVSSSQCRGFIYDESAHNQIHPNIYFPENPNPPRYQWADPNGKSPEAVEQDITNEVKLLHKLYGYSTDLYSEQVFPVLYHILSRGGMHPCPKILKEEFQSLQLSSALGAAIQYGRKFGICIDLWGPDVGSWFTRLWGFPGHSPLEFEKALQLAWFFSPDFLFVENIDPLMRFSGGSFRSTEFGDVFEQFTKEFAPSNPLPYSFRDAWASTVLIRSDDALISSEGNLFGTGNFGSTVVPNCTDYRMQSVFSAFHLLSHGRLPDNGLTFFLPQYDFPKSHYPVNNETVKNLPLEQGEFRDVPAPVHDLFYPLHNVLVFDQHVGYHAIRNASLIVLAGSRISYTTLKAVIKRIEEGAVCLAVPWLLPHEYRNGKHAIGKGTLVAAEDFCSTEIRNELSHLLGNKDVWSQKFGEYELKIYNPLNDGISLEFELYHSS